MKNLIATLALTIASSTAFAHNGSNTLVCKSSKNSGSKQVIEFNLVRSNGKHESAPTYSLTVNGKKYEFTTENELKSYGETFHNSPLGVITVTADNVSEEDSVNTGYISVVAVPGSVKSYDTAGKLQKWNMKDEKDDCYDTNGKATFKGIFHGYLHSNDTPVDLDTQIMDCELSYNSGMAC